MQLTRRMAVVVTAVAVAVFAVAVLGTLLVLRSDPAPAPTAAPSTSAPPTTATAPAPTTALSARTPAQPGDQVMDVSPEADARYLSTLTAAGLITPTTDDSEVIEVGRLVCAYIASGQGDVREAAVTVLQSGETTANEAGTIVGAAVGAYCPQFGEGL